MKLYLIAGHGAGDPGAVGNGYQEAERVRALCTKIKEYGGNNVIVLDPSRNWYADKGISSLSLNSSEALLECHMDSNTSSSAKGGHVIIHKSYEPDKYDIALENMLKRIFPGRSQTIVKRSDLGNCNRAKAKNINYRLVEFGFISNANDVKVFNSQIDEIAKEVLKAFEIPLKENKSWYSEAQDWVISKGISDGSRPTEQVTRAEVWTMLHRFSKLK